MVTAIFPMRGQPPHIGHILTIVRIYDDYDKIILHIAGYTDKDPREDVVIPPEEVVRVFREIFKYMPKIEVILGTGLFRDKTNFDDLPQFHVIVTGNKDFVKLRKNKTKPIRFISRSTIHDFDISGTILRKVMKANKKGKQSLN